MNLKKIITFFCFLITLTNIYSKGENIGFCLDTKGSVQRYGSIRNGLLRKGDSIYDGDKIITGESGFISYAFINEKTNVKVFENSVIRVNSLRKKKGSSSEIALFGGKVIIETEKNSLHPFIVKSPSSTCSTLGSHFITEYKNELIYDNLSYCLFTVLGGAIKVQNNTSKNIMYLKNKETIISTMNGNFLQLDTFRNNSGIQKTLIKDK